MTPTSRARRLLASTVAALAVLLTTWTASSSALIEQVKDGAETVEVGVTPRQPVSFQLKPLQWHGGSVDSATYFYAIYWDPAHAYHSDWMRLIDGYLHDVGAASGQLSNVFALNAEYRSATGARAGYNATFRGAYTDTTPYPASGCVEANVQAVCLTDGQLRAELKRFVQSEKLQTGREVVYYLLTPPAVTVCLNEGGSGNCSTSKNEVKEEEVEEGKVVNSPGLVENTTGFCGYHSVIEPGGENPIVYAVQPWIAGHAGRILSEIPLINMLPTGAALACQNSTVLVEPNQANSFINPDSYETGLADLIINGLSIEQNDIMVDPMLSDGWYQTGTNAEQSDMCRSRFGVLPPKQEGEEKLEGTHAQKDSNEGLNGNRYYLQWGYSSAAVSSSQDAVCWEGVEQAPHFTANTVVKGGDVIAFDALESGLTLDANLAAVEPGNPYTAPIYEWQFGDNTTVGPTTDASVFHAYQYGGEYQVTLTVTDSGGYVRSTTKTVPVSGPPAPAPPAPGGGSGSPSSPAGSGPSAGASSGGTTTSSAPSSAPTSGPTLTESVLSRSLKKALRIGIPVHYGVDEPVSGTAEALLDSATAARLHVKGRVATGLPKGYPREIVVGNGVIVATRAGQGTVRVDFVKSLAKRLAKARQLKLTLRFVLRSRSPSGIHVTTTFSTVVLSH